VRASGLPPHKKRQRVFVFVDSQTARAGHSLVIGENGGDT
jgi:hypothetical protein